MEMLNAPEPSHMLEIIQKYIIRRGSHRILRKTLENTHIGIILTIFLSFNS